MEVSKVPPADLSASRAGTATTAGTATSTAAATTTDMESSSAAISVVDEADIRPLDLAAAMQIVLAEVRAGLDAFLESPVTQNSIAQSPIQAAHELVDMFLRALPEDASDAPAWTAALIQVETAAQSGMERAVSVVAAWRDIPLPVVDAVKETRALFFSALGDEPRNTLWLRPEWMGLAPQFRRFWRRRRNARRRLTDPDYPLVNLDESEESPR
jgi:hypothetical protein